MRQLTFALTLLASALPAFAQTGAVIEEVLVTAEKRTASLQETALAVTAYDGEELDLRGIDGLEDLQLSAPNLVISHNAQSPVTYAYIRGVGSDQLVAGFDPGVAYHFDGLYIGQPSSMPGDLWDMDRVEVLRGPQGTLYGRNTTGGSINVITRTPSAEPDLRADLTYGNYDRFRMRLAGGGALADGVSGRLSAIFDRNDGYQRNSVGDNGDQTDFASVRGKLRFDLGENAELLLTAQHFANQGRQSQKKREPFGPVELAPGFVVNIYEGALPNPEDPRKVAKNHPEELDLNNDLLSARITWDLGPAQLVSITGYIENEWFQNSDIDMSSNAVQFQEWEMQTDQFTQEVQLVSAGDRPFEWILGAFYFDEDLDTDYFFEDSSIAGFVFMNGGALGTKSVALYGQASYDFRQTASLPLRLVAGVRWSKDRKKIDEFQQIPAFNVDLAAQSKESWDEWTGKVGLDWFLSEDAMAYVSLSRGYKGGGFSIGQFDTFDPEIVNAAEAGLKAQFWSRRAQLNAAAFYYDYQDLQVNFLLFTLFTTDNAAEATIKGLELEGTVLPTDNLMLIANLSFLNAKFDRYQFSETISLDGQRLNRAPKTSLSLAAQYEMRLGDAGTLRARADFHWQSKVYYRVQNIPRHQEGAFHSADARLIWTSADSRWQAEAFVKNLSDEDNQRGLTVSDGLSSGNNSFVSYFPPRTAGVRLGYSLGGGNG